MKRWAFSTILILSTILLNAQYNFIKQWDADFGSNNNDNFNEFLQTKDGGYILAGHTDGAVNGDITEPGRGGFDCWLVKIDSIGNKQWDKRFGGSGYDVVGSLFQTEDKGFFIGMSTFSGIGGDITEPSRGYMDYWIIKTDSIGNKQWDKRFGANGEESLQAVIQTTNGGYLIGGASNSGINGDKTEDSRGDSDFWLVKIDSAGNKQWDKRYGGSKIEGIQDVEMTLDGGYMLLGGSNSDSSGDKSKSTWGSGFNFRKDYWIVKIDSAGNKQWDKGYGGTAEDVLYSAVKTTDEGYLLGGQSESPISGDKTTAKSAYWIVRIDSNGNKLWDTGFNGAGGLYKVANTNDGGFLLSGEMRNGVPNDDVSENNLGVMQTWIVKTDSIGNKQWDKTIFTTQRNQGYAIQTNDGCYAVGSSCNGGIGGYKTQPNHDGVIDSTFDYWILKFCMEPFNGIGEPNTKGDLNSRVQVWPNPFASDLSIALTGSYTSTANFTITNTAGQIVYQQQETNLATGYTKMLDLSYLPNGVYFVEVTTSEGKAVKRVVKQ